MPKPAESIQSGLIRLLPIVEADENLAVEVAKVEGFYFVDLIDRSGRVTNSTKCENLATVFATITNFLVEKSSTEYAIEQ